MAQTRPERERERGESEKGKGEEEEEEEKAKAKRKGRRARFDFGDEFGEEAVGFGNVVRVAIAVEEVAPVDELGEQQAHDLAEVHAADHLLV